MHYALIILGALAVIAVYVTWRRRQRARTAVPEWARFFSQTQYRAFGSAVELALVERDLAATLQGGVVVALLPDGRPVQLGLQNLAQQCARADAQHWQSLIGAHVDAVLGAVAEAEAVDLSDFSQVRPLLRVRLFPTDALEPSDPPTVVARPVAEGLAAVLAYDLPSTVASVSPEALAPWGRTEDELFDLALDNVRKEQPPDKEHAEVERGVVLRSLAGDSFFVASHLLLIDRQLPGELPYGALVSVPTRHLVLYHAIRDARVLVAINALIPQTHRLYQQGPGSLSPNLYWYHKGDYLLLPTRMSDGTVKFTPPQAFVEAVMTPLAE
ncbi:MAG: hypothetical protein ABI333_14975 [bacterium]